MIDTTLSFLGHTLHLSNNGLFDVRKREEILIHIHEGGKRYFYLNEGNVLKRFDYGLFILHAYKRFFLPIDLWELVESDAIDQDENNFVIENLYVRYPKEGIEYKEKPGFYYIPGFELNVINREGEVFRLPSSNSFIPLITDKLKEENKQYVYTLINTNEKFVGKRVLHRLLAIVFKDPPRGYPKLIVDHLNGKKWDYSLDNMEWVTSSINNRRANELKLKKDGTPILVKNIETGKISEYFSITEFARQMKVHPQYIVDAKNKPNHLYKGNYIVKSIDDDNPWSHYEKLIGVKNRVRPKCRNVITGEISHFTSISKAEKVTGTVYNAIRCYLSGNSNPCIINGYEWKREEDDTPWAVFSEHQIEIYQRGLHRNTRVYEVTDIDTGVTDIHYGWRKLAELTGMDKRTIIFLAKDNRTIKHRYKVTVLN